MLATTGLMGQPTMDAISVWKNKLGVSGWVESSTHIPEIHMVYTPNSKGQQNSFTYLHTNEFVGDYGC